MIATKVIGPLSLREIVFRNDFDPAAICYHIDLLRDAGMSLDSSAFCTIVRSLAVENRGGVLKSVVDCDLHPDTFEDHSLQERLLAQYYHENDLVKIERTYAILTTGYTVKNLQARQTNLFFRSQVTLGRLEKVLALLEEMKRMGIPVTARSSRHLRVRWLSRRRVGHGPQSTEELSIIVQASQMTMQSGGSVSIIVWREILRRLGMAGRLLEVENLALWLVDWYSSPVVPKRAFASVYRGRALDEGHVSSEEPPNFHPKGYLNALFTTSARHAIIAWGFQHTPKPPGPSEGSSKPPGAVNPPARAHDAHQNPVDMGPASPPQAEGARAPRPTARNRPHLPPPPHRPLRAGHVEAQAQPTGQGAELLRRGHVRAEDGGDLGRGAVPRVALWEQGVEGTDGAGAEGVEGEDGT